MVTVHRAFGFRFVVFTNDHEPPHIHVFGHDGEAKIELADDGAVSVAWVHAISRRDLRRLVAEAKTHHAMLMEAWRRIHG